MSKRNHRALIFIAGIIFTVLFYTLISNVNTKYCRAYSPDEGIALLSGTELYSLNEIMQPDENIGGISCELVLPKELFTAGERFLPCLYIPDSGLSSLTVNGTDALPEQNNEYIACSLADYISGETDGAYSFSVCLHRGSEDGLRSGELLFLGTQAKIERIVSSGSFQRFFVIGISFMILLYSLSLYFEKRSEKYLLFLAFLAYTTTARTLWNAIPALKQMFLPNILLLGTIQLPGVGFAASYYFWYLLLKFAIAYLRYLLIQEFTSVRLPGKRYFLVCAVLFCLLLPFCFMGHGYMASQIFILATHAFELMMLAYGAQNYAKVCLTLTFAWSWTVALRIFDILSSCNILPHGIIDAAVKLQGIVETLFTLAFVVVINLKFAHKYKEAEHLSLSLEHMNKNLEALVEKRTEELRRSNTELSSAYKQLHDVQVQKDEFMTNIIHNLKTPLFSLYGYADMAMDEMEDAPELAKKHLEEINKNTSYAKQLIDNLFLCMRLEDGKIKYNPMPFALSLLLTQLDSTSRARTDAAGIELCVEMPEKDIYLTADLLYIRQALQNIIDNAVRHSSAGTKIEITARETEKDGKRFVSINIRDRGEGIAPDEMPLIFGRYYSGGKKGATSSGLGLTITKEIIEQHGGFIDVESTPGEGTCFSVSLPEGAPEEI